MNHVGMEALEDTEADKKEDGAEGPKQGEFAGFQGKHGEQEDANNVAANRAAKCQCKYKHSVPPRKFSNVRTVQGRNIVILKIKVIFGRFERI